MSRYLSEKMERDNLEAKIFRDTDYNEFIVRFYKDNTLIKEADYFTDDREDAVGTAEAELKHMEKIYGKIDK